jgi:hypothetical protein
MMARVATAPDERMHSSRLLTKADYRLIQARLMLSLLRLKALWLKANFDPNQPRVPRGHPDEDVVAGRSGGAELEAEFDRIVGFGYVADIRKLRLRLEPGRPRQVEMRVSYWSKQ